MFHGTNGQHMVWIIRGTNSQWYEKSSNLSHCHAQYSPGQAAYTHNQWAVELGTGQGATLCDQEGNRWSGVTLAMRQTLWYIQDGPKKVSLYQESSLNCIKIASTATFLINFEYKVSTTMLLVCIKYSMCDLICDVISCCVWSCNVGKQKRDLKPEKR